MTIERAFAVATDTLDQTSYTQVDSMTLTPDAGDYLATFSMQIQFNASPDSSTLKVAIYVDGVQQQHSIRTIQQNSSLGDMYWGVMTSAYVSPTGSQVVEVRYVASFASAPMAGTTRELNLFPAPNTNYQDTDVVTDTIATATWTTIDTMTRTPASGTYLLLFSTSSESPIAERVAFRLSVGGTPVAHTERHQEMESSAAPAIYTIVLAAKITPNGSQVVEIEWQRFIGSGTQSCYERNMILIEIPTADIFQAPGTANDADSTTSNVAIDDMLITDPGVADYLILFSSYDMYPTLSAEEGTTTYKFYIGGAEDTNLTILFQHEDSIDWAEMVIYKTGRVTLSAETDDIQMYWQSDTTIQRTIYTRTLIAIREPTETYKLEGVTYDKNGDVEVSVDCYLWKDNLDDTLTFVDYVLSNGATGAYSFTGISDNDAQYMVVFIKDGSPNIFDVTDHVLQPVIE